MILWMSLVCFMLFTYELSCKYIVFFSCDCNKFNWNRLKTMAVFEAYTTVDKNFFVSIKIYFEWNFLFIVTIQLKLIGSSMKKNRNGFYTDH